jgi:hypothetical protein
MKLNKFNKNKTHNGMTENNKKKRAVTLLPGFSGTLLLISKMKENTMCRSYCSHEVDDKYTIISVGKPKNDYAKIQT